jgi:hypothetical protein
MIKKKDIVNVTIVNYGTSEYLKRYYKGMKQNNIFIQLLILTNIGIFLSS